jgi:putative membrane protein insertion efficiency factor
MITLRSFLPAAMAIVTLGYLLLPLFEVDAACGVCYSSVAPIALIARQTSRQRGHSSLLFPVINGMLRKHPVTTVGIFFAHRAMADGLGRALWVAEDKKAKESEGSQDVEKESAEKAELEKDNMSTAMIASIGFYKQVISPLLPPACRFVPTCSQYGVQAIQQYGSGKGGILTAWRLLRCSPIGGKGYDPPKWPPVTFTFSSY